MFTFLFFCLFKNFHFFKMVVLSNDDDDGELTVCRQIYAAHEV